MRIRRSGLWADSDFVTLWAGQSVSMFGSQISLLALPLTAALTLHASPGQMGLLTAAGTLPSLLLSLFAGVWIDRHRRRPVLLWSNLGRAVLLGVIPVAAWLDQLSIGLLIAIAFLAGLLTLGFEIAWASYLPSLITRDCLAAGNGHMQVSRSAASAAGPGLAGALVQWLTAPVAILADAISFAVAAASLLLIRARERAPDTRTGRDLRVEVSEGLRFFLTHPILRPIGIWAGTFNFFGGAAGAVLVLFVTRDLGQNAGVFALVVSAGSIGGLIGAVLAGRAVRRLGLGRSMVAAGLIVGLSQLLVPLAAGPAVIAVAILVLAQTLFGLTAPLLNINIASLQQIVTPNRLMGRVNASVQLVTRGTLPLGALLGGALAGAAGVRAALAVAAAGMCLSFVVIWRSPLRAMRRAPAPPPELIDSASPATPA